MRGVLGFALLLSSVACGGEARKLGEVDVGGSSGGVGAVASGGVPLGSGGSYASGGIYASGGSYEVSGGTGGTPNGLGGGDGVTLGTGGQTGLNGGAIPITNEERDALVSGACAGSSAERELIPVHVELVIDNSASMRQAVQGANGLSKWDVTRDALLEAVVGVKGPGMPAWVDAGLLVYPRLGADRGVGICSDSSGLVPGALLGAAGSAQRSAIADRLLDARPNGMTSTFAAYDNALNHELLTRGPLGRRFMILVTDGAPTSEDCYQQDTPADIDAESIPVDPAPIIQEISDANLFHGIKTFVVGTEGSEANRRWLSDAAVQGGTAAAGCTADSANCHIDLTLNPDLNAALNNDALMAGGGSVISCSFPLATPPAGSVIDLNQIYVMLVAGGQRTLLLRSDASDCSTGWILQNGQVLLCSDSCAQARDVDVEIVIGCQVVTR